MNTKIDIKNDINNNYLLFLEKNELIKYSIISKWKINRIKKKFAKRSILVIVLNSIHEIYNYIYQTNQNGCKKVFLVHGDETQMNLMNERLALVGIRAEMPEQGQVFDL
jgi:hypothetical protein